MKLEVLTELRETHEAFKGGLAHLGDVFELHVVGDEGLNLAGVVVGEAEPAAKFFGHADTDFDMAVETDAVAGFGSRAESGGLADVVEENAPGECRRSSSGKAFEHEEGVDPDVAFGMELWRLRYAFQGGDFGQQFGEK